MRKLALRLIGFYRAHLSARKRMPTCKYYPTCSEYAFRAYETHGFFVATALSAWRILRCNPFSRGGIDYVPGTPERKAHRERIAHEKNAYPTAKKMRRNRRRDDPKHSPQGTRQGK